MYYRLCTDAVILYVHVHLIYLRIFYSHGKFEYIRLLNYFIVQFRPNRKILSKTRQFALYLFFYLKKKNIHIRYINVYLSVVKLIETYKLFIRSSSTEGLEFITVQPGKQRRVYIYIGVLV